jgi:hypothetical protein
MIALERAAAGGLTVEALAERFLEDYARSKNLKSVRKYEQAIATHILPQLGEVSVDALDREQIRSLIRQVRVPRARADTKRGRAHGGVEAARRALGVLRLMVGWAIEERLSSTARIIRRAEWRGTYPRSERPIGCSHSMKCAPCGARRIPGLPLTITRG